MGIKNSSYMPYIDYDAGLGFHQEVFSCKNIIFMTINETIDITHRRIKQIDRYRYIIIESLTSLPYSDTVKSFSEHVCRTCA